ncbi:5-formyltetrahydrofolate cyclo-ligase [Micromonospora sediminimaris]|uniref:5-formyltetrahydrofolate cyclo-ligase n=1 Tax=Micromonospora sediminimaris TaxID=547162 RepID=A0A9W5XMN1_9ACTN|nr:5-formyltetrahydrofolate cyclo-ligase [Micromonospora sediminimaris]GIJ36620.1 5-formyltetrahydrofolate cyclo-ligase [Micromonospora sediminimaris]SFC03209.1 5-formyltetrahydrofolate cyclo-ligase [Micromonospora sediminimaris]
MTSTDDAKQAVRRRVWDLLEREGMAPPGVHGHIPDFTGKDDAAARLADLDVWKKARVIKCNPDRAQLPVRVRALQEGKLLYMAVPRLATPKPFYLLDPAVLTVPFETAATSKGAPEITPTVGPDEMRPVDMIVCGSVAISRRNGVRVGKGAGYSDLEIALLTEAGLVTRDTAIATTVHQSQLLDEELPDADHDFSVDYAITPEEVVACAPDRARPSGIVRGNLRPDQLDNIPALR